MVFIFVRQINVDDLNHFTFTRENNISKLTLSLSLSHLLIKYKCIRIFFLFLIIAPSSYDEWKVILTKYSGFWYSNVLFISIVQNYIVFVLYLCIYYSHDTYYIKWIIQWYTLISYIIESNSKYYNNRHIDILFHLVFKFTFT